MKREDNEQTRFTQEACEGIYRPAGTVLCLHKGSDQQSESR